jgi:hypothetical protein
VWDEAALCTQPIKFLECPSDPTLEGGLITDNIGRRFAGASYAGNVPADARVASFAAQIVGDGRPFAVIDVDGTMIGRIERDDVVDVLAGRSRPR